MTESNATDPYLDTWDGTRPPPDRSASSVDDEQAIAEAAREAYRCATLGDAFCIGLELSDTFTPGPFCAVWIGHADGTLADLIVLTDERAGDVPSLVTYALLSARTNRPADRVVLWRCDDDLTDAPSLAAAYFERRDDLADGGLKLVDEIVLSGDDIRSLAVTTFTDADGWDDVTSRLAEVDE